MSKKLISIVTPVYNEEKNVMRCHHTIAKFAASISDKYRVEHIFTDNHSTDRTFEMLADIALKDPSVRVFRFSKNFGYQRSIYDGLMRSRGDAVIQFDGDLQDPPEMMLQFIKEWEDGSQIVYGIRKKRQEGWLDVLLRRIFYRVLNWLSTEGLPQDAGDFRLIDKKIITELRKVQDNRIYLRGRISEMGFKQKGIPYERLAREAGTSKFNFSRNLALAIDAVLTHSTLPLRISIYFGIGVFCLSIFGSVAYLIAYYGAASPWPPGFMTLLGILLLNLALTCLFLGVLGEYVARIYEHLKVPQGTILEEAIDAAEQV
ncbi:MAG: glycosyltransferase family 2 protein [Bdellovibrionales bacterium]